MRSAGPACTVCTSPQREAIDEALLAGRSYRDIARQYRVTKDAVGRHLLNHIAPEVLASQLGRRETLQLRIEALQQTTLALLEKAERAKSQHSSALLIREARGNLELLAKLAGVLDERPQVNILVSPQWVELRAVIVEALRPHPDALAAVRRALGDGS